MIPPAVRLSGGLDLPAGRSEPDVAALFSRYTVGQPRDVGDDVFRRAPAPTTTRSRRS